MSNFQTNLGKIGLKIGLEIGLENAISSLTSNLTKSFGLETSSNNIDIILEDFQSSLEDVDEAFFEDVEGAIKEDECIVGANFGREFGIWFGDWIAS